MLFFIKNKRKINKNAENQPKIVRDYSSPTTQIIQNDSISFANIDIIASAFAGLNYGIYDVKTRQKIKRHALLSVLRQPNLEDRHFNFFYQSAIDYFNGGCFWYKSKVDGEVISLFRLSPNQVRIKRNDFNIRMYMYNGHTYIADEIVYIPSRFNYSTLSGGKSIFDAVRGAFKTSQDLESYTQASFANGGFGKHLIIDVQGAFPNLTKDQATEIKNGFVDEYGGAQNAGKPILKKKGFEYSELGSNADNKAQELAENRKYQKSEIDTIFHMPEKWDDLEKSFTLFYEFAVKPMATQFQEAINSLLDEDRFYFEFDYNGVMKVSLQQRIEAYTKQITNGLMSPNEARQKENLPPIEAGDNHFMPVNLMPLNDETINAYMAKQKNEVKHNQDPTDQDSQHFGGGDDKQ